MKQLLLLLVLFFSLIAMGSAQGEYAVAFHQNSTNQTILVHKGDYLKIHAADSTGTKRLYKGKFDTLESGAIHLKYYKAGIPIQGIDRMKIRPHGKQWGIWASLGIGLLLLLIGFIVSLNGLFPPKGQLENSGLKTGPKIMLVGLGMLAVLLPIQINASFQSMKHLNQDWTYETLTTFPTTQVPVP